MNLSDSRILLVALALSTTVSAALSGCGPKDAPASGTSTSTAVAPAAGASATSVPESSTPPAITTRGLARGAAPSIAYLRATEVGFGTGTWRLVRPDGSRQVLDEATWSEFSVLGDAVVGSFGTEGGVALDVIGPDGVLDRTVGFRHFGLATTPDHSIVAYLDDEGAVHSIEAEGARELTLPAVQGAKHLGAILGSATCQEQVPEGGGCGAFVDQRRGRTSITTSHGIVERIDALQSIADAATGGRLIGTVTPEPEQCDGLLNPRGRVAWQTCDRRLEDFSPDGRHILGTVGGPVEDISGISVFDLDGTAVAAWSWRADLPHRMVDVTWEDDEHVLAVVRARGSWTVLRLGLDQSVERATRWLPAGPDYATYKLPIG